MSKLFSWTWLWIGRLCLPVSFLLALIFAPIAMFLSWREWPAMVEDMWSDPL